MKLHYTLPILALLGLGLAVAVIIHDNRPADMTNRPLPARQPPFASHVAGTGRVEAATGDIAVGTPVSGIVMTIAVKVGDQVQSGTPLFTIDDRDLKAELKTAEARVEEAAAALREPKDRLEIAEQLAREASGAISTEELKTRRDRFAAAEAALKLAQAEVAQTKEEIERHIVRALVAGEVLQVNIHPGEFVEGGGTAQPLILLGGDSRLYLRVEVDEEDAWRVRPGAAAVAYPRGDATVSIPLHYEYTEPYMVAKTDLTGRSTERTDTRVLQVLYSFSPTDLPVYAGQQLDVFIEATATADAKEKRP